MELWLQYHLGTIMEELEGELTALADVGLTGEDWQVGIGGE